MNVKVFVFRSTEVVESEISNWIAQSDIEVCHITQSQSEKQGWFYLVISVFYRKVQEATGIKYSGIVREHHRAAG